MYEGYITSVKNDINLHFTYKVGSRFATVPFPMIHSYGPRRVGPSTPDLRCITIATQAYFLYLVRFYLFSGVNFFLFLFYAISFNLTVIFQLTTATPNKKKRQKRRKNQKVAVKFSLDVF
jgi:hypothetical protein